LKTCHAMDAAFRIIGFDALGAWSNASQRVLAKCGFQYVGEITDPEDGLVWRFERRRKLLTRKTVVAAEIFHHAVLASFAPLLLMGCGSPANPPASAPPAIAAKPDVIVTFDGERHSCVVALYSEAQGSMVPCTDIVPFIRDELKVASGSIYDTRTIAPVDAAEVAKTTQNLKAAGYRFIGGH